MITIHQIAQYLESLAPKSAAMSYDNVGLQTGSPDTIVEKILIALDLTPQVIQEAQSIGANLIITHHPNIFLPLKSVSPNTLNGAMILSMLRADIAHYTIHTNLDAMREGVSFALARQIGLSNLSFLDPLPDSLLKLVVFVPQNHAQQLREALGGAGAGQIGNYGYCAFETEGSGYFQPNERAQPHIGTAHQLEKVSEIKLEVVFEQWKLGAVLQAMKTHHPYEEIAHEIYALRNGNPNFGMGAIGTLPNPMAFLDFLTHICEALNTPALRYAGNANQMVSRVAVCGGSGGSLIGKALSKKADVYLTGDLTYHQYFSVHNNDGIPQMGLVDVGHYESEACTTSLLNQLLKTAFPQLSVQITEHTTNGSAIFTAA